MRNYVWIYCPGNCGEQILIVTDKYKGASCNDCKWTEFLKKNSKKK